LSVTTVIDRFVDLVISSFLSVFSLVRERLK